MKKISIGILMTCFVVGFVGCAGMQPTETKIYTAYNIWIHKHMKCINYKMGESFIPVGTELKYIRTGNGFFVIGLNEKRYEISFNPNWHTDKKMRDYINYLSTEKTFDEMVEGMSELEINVIKQGKIVIGMSKAAVLLSYGRPPEHRTSDLDSDKWRYWMNKRVWKFIHFYNGKTVTQGKYERNRDL